MRLLAYVSGLGFGIMSGVFSFVNTLSDSLGPGIVGIHGDSPQFFLNSAFMTLVIILLHVFWGIIFFDACEKKKWYILLVVLLTHLLVSTQRIEPRVSYMLPDLPKSSLWNKSGVSIYNYGAHGHLGIFCCGRQLPKPETLPALPRQGLSSLPPTLQITSDSQYLPTTGCVIRGSTAVPFSKKKKKEKKKRKISLFLMEFWKNCLDRNSICLAFKKQISEKDASVVSVLAAC
ncbi:gamma-secretase subunit APH-1B isoform X2 [Sciurus carolinensis]|nr:gamma-secretase subunit APH-1B isoform X2 [Sciurus carolinensis]